MKQENEQIKAGRESGEREGVQQEKGEQEITQTAYLKVKEGYSDEMQGVVGVVLAVEVEGVQCFGLLVNAREEITALPYKTWVSAEA